MGKIKKNSGGVRSGLGDMVISTSNEVGFSPDGGSVTHIIKLVHPQFLQRSSWTTTNASIV